MQEQFRYFLFNEQKYYLGQKAGDILTAIQSLEEDAPQLGNRALMRAAQGLVGQIRRILHGRWDESDYKYLRRLQKVGVAIMKTIDEKDDLGEVIASSGAEVQKMLDELEVPINNVGAEGDMDAEEEGFSDEKTEEPLTPGSQIGA